MNSGTRSVKGDAAKIAKSGQEQAVAAWANYLNQLRLDQLVDALRRQDVNLRDALASVDEAIDEIKKVVASNRGGLKGMHGFIAEVAETGVGNARSQILGGNKVYEWVDDNGPFDLMREGVAIQQKFYAAGGNFGLGAIAEHLRRYPGFIESGHRYQIPSNHYEVVRELYLMPREEAGKALSRSSDGPSFKDWQRVQAFFEEGLVPFESLEPSHLDYREVQQGAYGATMAAEKDSLHETDQGQRDSAYLESKPSLKQGSQVTVTAAAIEGSATFVMAVVAKRRTGKRLSEFTGDDWAAIACETGFGFAKGGMRGLSIYTLTNFTATSAAAASAIVTAAFGVAEQANKLRRSEIDELEFIENAELISLEAAVGALSSFIGQASIPVPILGAVIGNTVGLVLYRTASSSLSRRESELIERYLEEQRVLDERLAVEYQELVGQLDAAMSDYIEMLGRAFSPDVGVALVGSVNLALEVGVASEEVLDSEEKVLAYFLD